MKSHAAAGADILSAIDFPYPVVPIVRHHHENWDGKGYPDGISGADIPIGARILSVVDCFDALTSDRPYRPKLSDQDAIQILLERRATMYDPLVVDTFVRVHGEISPERTPSKMPPQILEEIASARNTAVPPDAVFSRIEDAQATPEALLTLAELSDSMASDSGAMGETLSRYVRRFIPFSHLAVFLYDVDSDELIVRHVNGSDIPSLREMRTKPGQGLSGWVGASRQTIANSDPALDLGDIAREVDPPLLSSLSAPILFGEQLVGVITLYSPLKDGFRENHRRLLDVISRQVAPSLNGRLALETAAQRSSQARVRAS
jgi:putative methionine-R-sulfoxide reductase with GAF domain